jgi:formylglycine-generating enzyme required for sulfatase activity
MVMRSMRLWAGFGRIVFGLYDMSGNVWEWTCSVYDKGYWGGEQVCASNISSDRRAVRGGSAFPELPVRSSYRERRTPDDRRGDVGFRLAMTP